MITYSNKQYPYVNITSIPFDEIECIDLAKCNFLLPFKISSTISTLDKVIEEFFRKKTIKKQT